ncbi:uncharacterized protein LOC123396306 [Hordeum vulgare subsp. vulgare]|uniref:uncharacterized protein LOC123396306 n=1 Tax=Hordeum vulgare subsp. vulgare TaxID=112509 RepID=UPI001D1A57A0|nr:uncharacterized protein LOC123396306 [Hordeum vulgare subsp. vulgare]
MAVADAALPCPPTPPLSAWIVVVAVALVRLALTPMLVRFALTPMLMLMRVQCVLAGALACLFFATAWVTSAASAAQVVAGRAWGEGSAPFLFLQELMYGAFKVCVYSFLVFLALAVLLVCVAYVIAVVSGSTSGFKKGEMVGSVMEDVGIFGMHAIACVMIPAVVLGLWRDCQADRKAPSHFSFVPRPNSVDGAVPSKLEAAKKHHHLDLNTLRGHTDCITVLDFSSDACNLATDDPLLKAIRGDTLSAAQQDDLPIVMNLLNIKQHQARSLFIFHRWKIDCILRKKLEKASYFTNVEKLKVGYTSRTRIRRATAGEGI